MRRAGRGAGLVCLLLLFRAVAATPQPGPALGQQRQPVNLPHRTAKGHVLVKFRPGADLPRSAARLATRAMALGRVRPWRWAPVRIPPGMSVGDACAWLRRLPGVELAAPDPIVSINLVPDDPYFLASPQDPDTCAPGDDFCEYGACQWALWMTDAPAHWETHTGSPSVAIAIIDSGVDLDHPDLAANIWGNAAELAGDPDVDDDGNGYVDDFYGWDFCGDNVGDPVTDSVDAEDNNPDVPEGGNWEPYPDDELIGYRFVGDPAVGDAQNNDQDPWGLRDSGVSHGTMVAGIAAAATDNATAFAGTAWSCRIMAVRMINAEGWGYGLDAADAIRYAADTGARVMNTSWGIDVNAPDPDGEKAVIGEAVQYAHALGCTIVSAAGNDGVPPLNHPGIMEETIAVGGTTPVFDADGFTVVGEEWVDFSNPAPAAEIPDDDVDNDGNGYVDDVVDVVCGADFIWNAYVLSAYDSVLTVVFGEYAPPGVPDYSANMGTSFSAPLAAGYAALLQSRYPDFGPEDIRATMRHNAAAMTRSGSYDPATGFGSIRLGMDPGPTAVLAGQLALKRLGRDWVFSWISRAVPEIAGYNLYAAAAPDAAYKRLNRSLIAPGPPMAKRPVEFKAPAPQASGPWFRLEAVYLNGRTERLPAELLPDDG